MSRLFNLVQDGNELIENRTDENSNFDKWISESLLYVEKNYSNTEFAKFFIADVELFKETLFTYKRADEGILKRLVSHVDAMKSHEEWLETQETLNKEEAELSTI